MTDDMKMLLHFIRDRALTVHTVYHRRYTEEGKVPFGQCPLALCAESRRVLEKFQ